MTDKYFVFKQAGEEVHKILAGSLNDGELKTYAKLVAGGEIIYKIFLEPQNGKPRILKEGKTSEGEFQRIVQYYEKALLKPSGGKWREIKPVVIELDDKEMQALKYIPRIQAEAGETNPETGR